MAVEKSFFFDSVNSDRLYTAQEFNDFFALFLSDGVTNLENNLKVEHHSEPYKVQVLPGGAMVGTKGYILKESGGPMELKIDPLETDEPRCDRIVLRKDDSGDVRQVCLTVKKGQPGQDPQPPNLTPQRGEKEGDIKEISLAKVLVEPGKVLIEEITDERDDEELCGVIKSHLSASETDSGNTGETGLQMPLERVEIGTEERKTVIEPGDEEGHGLKIGIPYYNTYRSRVDYTNIEIPARGTDINPIKISDAAIDDLSVNHFSTWGSPQIEGLARLYGGAVITPQLLFDGLWQEDEEIYLDFLDCFMYAIVIGDDNHFYDTPLPFVLAYKKYRDQYSSYPDPNDFEILGSAIGYNDYGKIEIYNIRIDTTPGYFVNTLTTCSKYSHRYFSNDDLGPMTCHIKRIYRLF